MRKGEYPWSFVTQSYRNDQIGHSGDHKTFEVMTSTEPLETLDSVVSSTLYHENYNRNQKFWKIAWTESYILHMQVLLVCHCLPFQRTWVHPRFFSGVRVTRYLLLYYILQIVVCPFVLFLLAIVLFVLLRFTDSDYPFDIFKLFLHKYEWFTIGTLKS